MLSLIFFLPVLASATYLLPLPNGTYGVSRQSTLITSLNNPDPYLNLSYTRVPISIIAPTGPSTSCQQTTQPYIPSKAAVLWEAGLGTEYQFPLNNTFTATQLTLCTPPPTAPSTPLLFFLPAAGISQYFYHILATHITAATGYTIITLDIPGQTEVVVFPDGSVQTPASVNANASYTRLDALDVYLHDILAVLDTLNTTSTTSTNNNQLTNLTLPSLDLTQMSILGHSEGGAASLLALLIPALSSLFKAGINIDGGFSGISTSAATTAPFMIVAHEGNNQTITDWTPYWDQVLAGDKWQIEINGTQHDGLSDFSVLADLYGLRSMAPRVVGELFGTASGEAVVGGLVGSIGAFFGYVFGGTNVLEVAKAVGGVEGVEVVNVTVY